MHICLTITINQTHMFAYLIFFNFFYCKKMIIQFNNIRISQPKLSSPLRTVISDFYCICLRISCLRFSRAVVRNQIVQTKSGKPWYSQCHVWVTQYKIVVWWEPMTNGGSSRILDMRNVQPTFWNIKKKERISWRFWVV